MPDDAGSLKYILREPFERASKSLHRSLTSRGLRSIGQVDLARRVEQYLGIVLPPCKIVFVLPGPSLFKSASVDPRAALFLPLHIVLSSNETETSIDIQNRVHADPRADGPKLVAPIGKAQAQLSDAIEAVAMRSNLCL